MTVFRMLPDKRRLSWALALSLAAALFSHALAVADERPLRHAVADAVGVVQPVRLALSRAGAARARATVRRAAR